jgi:hypothetical protein
MFGILAISPIVAAFWVWICVIALLRRGFWPLCALQLSAVMFAYGLVTHFSIASATFMAMAPPVSLWFIVYRIFEDAPPFAANLFLFAMPFGLASTFICLMIPNLRVWIVSIVSASVFVFGFIISEVYTSRAMCRAGATLGISEFERKTSLWSFKAEWNEFRSSFHAMARKDEREYTWSYYKMQWEEREDRNHGALYPFTYLVSCKNWLL